MMNVVNANKCSKKQQDNTSPVEIELFATFIFDGLLNCRTQQKARNIYRGKASFSGASIGTTGLSVYSVDNPQAKPSTYVDKPADETHIHRTFHLDLRSYMFTPARYYKTMQEAKRQVRQFVNGYCVRDDVYSIKFHAVIVGYNVGSAFFNILQSFDVSNVNSLNKEIRKFFDPKSFLYNPKLAYKALETIYIFDPTGTPTIFKHQIGSFPTEVSDIGGSDEVCYDSPLQEDVVDAAVMCQNTYYTQTDIQQSVWTWVKSKISEVFTGKKKTQPKPGETIMDNFMRNESELDDVNIRLVKEADARWEIMPDNFTNYLTGFYAKLYYKKTKRNGKNVFAFCTCGTNFTSPVDWIFANAAQFLCGISPQYTESVRVAKQLDKKHSRDILFFIGHSLGGGLASNNALVTKTRHAITFNAAGLNFTRVIGTLLLNNSRDLFHVADRKAKIHAYVIEGEILNYLLGNHTINIHQGAYGKVKRVDPSKSEMLSEIKGHGDKHAVLNFLKLKDNELSELQI